MSAATQEAPMLLSLRMLYDEHAPYVMRCLRYLGVREADLDDATQETFMVANRKLGSLRASSSHRAWLYAIALNVARHARRKRTTLPLEDAGIPADNAGAARIEARSELMMLLSPLDDDKREVIVLYHLEQMTLREIADVIDTPLQTVYSRLQAATKQIEAARRAKEQS